MAPAVCPLADIRRMLRGGRLRAPQPHARVAIAAFGRQLGRSVRYVNALARLAKQIDEQ